MRNEMRKAWQSRRFLKVLFKNRENAWLGSGCPYWWMIIFEIRVSFCTVDEVMALDENDAKTKVDVMESGWESGCD